MRDARIPTEVACFTTCRSTRTIAALISCEYVKFVDTLFASPDA